MVSLLLLLMVSDIKVSEFLLGINLLGVGKVSLDFLLVSELGLLSLSCWGRDLNSLSHLYHFKTQFQTPLSLESVVLLISVESRSDEFLSPHRLVHILCAFIDPSDIRVLNHLLVVVGEREGPDVFLVHSVVNERHVRVRRVRVHTFSLHIEEFQFLVVVFLGDGEGFSHSCPFFRVEGLQTLPVVVLLEPNIV